MKRIFLIVLDSLGIGNAPDADKFMDKGANTLKSIHATGKLNIKNLESLGLGYIDGVDFLSTDMPLIATVARLSEVSMGKDSTIGHWEIAGIISKEPLPTYPNGFPEEIINALKSVTGRGVLCNMPYSGTDVIRDFGHLHKQSGDLIVYTSADSVFQIAAHEKTVELDELYEICEKARKILVGKHAVGRVIARPFTDDGKGGFVRTKNRHDYSLVPPKRTMLDAIKNSGKEVIAVGKITDLFAGKGITVSIPTKSNSDGMKKTIALLNRDFTGLAFTNLVDFDTVYGHRQDAEGYAIALSEFDVQLGEFISKMSRDDLLVITADHGCDPSDNSTDHTRECVPLIMYSKKNLSKNLGTLSNLGNVATFICKELGVDFVHEM